MENVVLIGADDVRSGYAVERGGQQVSQAASTLEGAATRFEMALYNHEIFLTQWLDRLEKIMTPASPEVTR